MIARSKLIFARRPGLNASVTGTTRNRLQSVSRPAFLAALALIITGCGNAPTHDAPVVQAPRTPRPSVTDVEQPAPATEPQSAPDAPQPSAADALFAALTRPDTAPAEWEAAHAQLLSLGGKAVGLLSRELSASDPMRREMAASLLAMLGPDAAPAADALRTALQDESVYVRANAATALCALPEHESAAIPVLLQLLVHEEAQVRQIAAVNLGALGADAAPFVSQLTELLTSAPDDAIVAIVSLLGRIGPDAAAAEPRLQQIAFERDGEARQAATTALQQITAEPAAE